MSLTTLLIVVNLQTGLQFLSPTGLGVMVSDAFAHTLCALAGLRALFSLTKPLTEN